MAKRHKLGRKVKVGKNRKILVFSDLEKHTIIQDYMSSNLSKRQIWKKYTGRENEHGDILNWMRKFGYIKIFGKQLNYPDIMSKKKTNKVNISENTKLAAMQREINELKYKLKMKEIEAIAYSTMIDVAEEQLDIKIRKKLDAIQLPK